MLEKQLAKDFNTIFQHYKIWTPNNRTAGWPDRGIQLSGSRMIWFELKIVTDAIEAIRISNLTQQQAAWLGKWQMNGGYCFLFLGLENKEGILNRYGILRCMRWDIWPKVPQQPIAINQLALVTNDKSEINQWFRDLFLSQGTQSFRGQ